MEVVSSPKTFVTTYQDTTPTYNTEYYSMNLHCYENLKSYFMRGSLILSKYTRQDYSHLGCDVVWLGR